MTTLQITRASDVLPEAEIRALQPVVDDINRLKLERNAVVAAHNYGTSDIFHLVADITGDFLALAHLALDTSAKVKAERARRAVFRMLDVGRQD